MIALLTTDDLLPPGDCILSPQELRASMLVIGPGDGYPDWDTAWRLQRVGNLEIMAKQLWHVGVQDIFIDGSFVDDKDHPNDIDGYFNCDLQVFASGQLQGLGIRPNAGHTETTPRNSCRCGTNIV